MFEENQNLLNSIFLGEVASVHQYGAFIKLAGNKNQGLVHRTQISNSNVDDAADVLQKGDRVWCKVIKLTDDGKISLSMKVVDQGGGKDLDPNGVQIHQDEQKRRERPNSSGRKKIELEAVFNTTCSKCGVRGHIAKDCFKDPTGKTYELLPDEDVPDRSQEPETLNRDIKKLKKTKKKHKKNKKKRHHSSSDSSDEDERKKKKKRKRKD
ncbi:zinc finger CCHC domain-containing protein 17 [Halyomorpha halys]|uniref:zinc finger CCHC domain-containing protein 17 n=1 Tax=Halyomorpha halys TaxID=286706 RepID=UPI0006D4DB55|nr:nucleolar protein of 40 kDa [Halyomorpha halys]